MKTIETTMEGYITLEEAALYLCTKKSWLYQNHKQLSIPSYNLGRKLLFRVSELDSWLSSQN